MKRLGWTIFFLFIAYFIFLIRQDIIDARELKGERDRLTAVLAREVKASAELDWRLRRLQNPDLIEELARIRLGLIKKGETAYKVIR
jgi:cell division protein FtsB